MKLTNDTLGIKNKVVRIEGIRVGSIRNHNDIKALLLNIYAFGADPELDISQPEVPGEDSPNTDSPSKVSVDDELNDWI